MAKKKKRSKKPVFHHIKGGPEVLEHHYEVYTFKGEEDYVDEKGYPRLELDHKEMDNVFHNFDAYAVRMTLGDKTNYYVKRGKHGRLFNPIGMFSEGQSRKQMRHAGKPEWSLQATNRKVFDLYINFLKTRNAAWLTNAEREV